VEVLSDVSARDHVAGQLTSAEPGSDLERIFIC